MQPLHTTLAYKLHVKEFPITHQHAWVQFLNLHPRSQVMLQLHITAGKIYFQDLTAYDAQIRIQARAWTWIWGLRIQHRTFGNLGH